MQENDLNTWNKYFGISNNKTHAVINYNKEVNNIL